MERVRDGVASQLGIEFKTRDSYFRGGEYFRAAAIGGVEFVLVRNSDEEDEVIEEDYSDYQVLLYVDRHPAPDEIRERLAEIEGLVFLRRRERK
jgi:hypothetical protein